MLWRASLMLVVFVLALVGLLIAPASTEARARSGGTVPLVIVADTVVGGVRVLAKLDRATTVLGTASATQHVNDFNCRAIWRSIGLTLEFLDLGARDPCGAGRMVTAVVTSRKWRTSRGLRVGDSVARLRHVYPRARHLMRPPYPGWWLITRRTCRATGSQSYPGLRAAVTAQRVSSLVVVVAACE